MIMSCVTIHKTLYMSSMIVGCCFAEAGPFSHMQVACYVYWNGMWLSNMPFLLMLDMFLS